MVKPKNSKELKPRNLPWEVTKFVDARPKAEYHSYRISPQSGTFGSMSLEDATLACEAVNNYHALKDEIKRLKAKYGENND